MKILCAHQNFPGQYLHLMRHLGADPKNDVVFITQRQDQVSIPGVRKAVYRPARPVTAGIHHYLADVEAGVLNAQNVARVALDLKAAGFVPDVMLGHNGWGEIWYLKDVFPQTPLIGYFEFFYRRFGADVGFDPDEDLIFDTAPRLRTKNLGNLLGLDAADMGMCPTNWQKSVYPGIYQPKLRVVHDGVDTNMVAPNPAARVALPSLGLELSAQDQVVTYVGRNLEPYRGFPSFMRSLPAILDRCKGAHVLIVGGDETSYGPPRADGKSFRTAMLEEVGAAIDHSRVHFLGKVPYDLFLRILQISSAHVYLTYPFVLSWSMLEAMAAGCLVIGSRTAPVEEVISDHENGLLVDFHSPPDIAEKVIAALMEPAAYRAIRANARSTVVERYDLKTVCLPKQLELLQIAREHFAVTR